MDMSAMPAELHMRTDANNLVTTASTTRLPEQKETIHMINQLRHEACSGAIDDLAHVNSTEMMADTLTKNSAKADNLIEAVESGKLLNADKHLPFREMMRYRHKAFEVDLMPMAEWLVREHPHPEEVVTFLGFEMTGPMRQALYDRGWYE